MEDRYFEKVREIISELMSVDPEVITPDTRFVDDLGADSLDLMEIIMGIEEAFDVQFDIDNADPIATVGEAVDVVRNAVDD